MKGRASQHTSVNGQRTKGLPSREVDKCRRGPFPRRVEHPRPQLVNERAHVEEGQVPPPQRLPVEIAKLQEKDAQLSTRTHYRGPT